MPRRVRAAQIMITTGTRADGLGHARNAVAALPKTRSPAAVGADATTRYDTLTYTRHIHADDAAVPELPVPRRFRDASRTPRSSTTNGAAPTALTELFASVADRFPDESRCSISRSSQAWDQASPKAGPGLSEVKFEAS